MEKLTLNELIQQVERLIDNTEDPKLLADMKEAVDSAMRFTDVGQLQLARETLEGILNFKQSHNEEHDPTDCVHE